MLKLASVIVGVAVLAALVALLATIALRPTIVPALPSLVVDLLLALIIVWPILVIRFLRRQQ